MDIDACIDEIISHLEVGEKTEAKRLIDYAVGWLRTGGFAPNLPSEKLEYLLDALGKELVR